MIRTVVAGVCVFSIFIAVQGALLPTTLEERVSRCRAVFRGNVLQVRSYLNPADGFLYTRTDLRVDETFKGKLPAIVRLINRGGEFDGRGEIFDTDPQLKVGEERLVFVGLRPDGALCAQDGIEGAVPLFPGSEGLVFLGRLRVMTAGGSLAGADLSARSTLAQSAIVSPVPPPASPSSVATNLLVGGDGIPARFLQPDRGDPIPYFVDADFLPQGITLQQALDAVQSAITAWTNVTSLRYEFMGVQSFGMAAANVPLNDGRLLIQLHDHYNYITSSGGTETLGVGGHSWVMANTPLGWTTGGNVIGSDFHKVTGGSIVIANTNSFFTGNPTNLAEVLCHELGHTIGLAHSSQNPSEPSPVLAGAIMYYLAHGNGRGATLNIWDSTVVQQVQPTNTPPWCYDRMIDAVSSPVAFTTPGVNTVEIRGYDLHPATLTFVATNQSSLNGSFTSLASGLVTYRTSGWFSDSGRLDPGSGSYYDEIFARWSDGLNASPYATVRVVAFWSDTYGEGIPDSWRLAYFGNANPSVGSNHHATNDFDGDGFNNVTEWRLGSNPTNRNSNLELSASPTNFTWQAKGYEVYEVWSSTNLPSWTRYGSPAVPTNFIPGTNIFNLTNSVGLVAGVNTNSPQLLFRILKVP